MSHEMQDINASKDNSQVWNSDNQPKARQDGGNFGGGETRSSMQKLGLSSGAPRVKSFFEEAKPRGQTDANGEIPGTLTTSGAVLGIISTILGGGLIAIPFAFYSTGFGLGLFIVIFAAVQVVCCSVLYLKAREACPNKPSSLFEIGYLTLGRPAIFLICFMVWVNSFFLIAIFINAWSHTGLSVTTNFAGGAENLPGWLTSRTPYGLLIALLLLPTCFMKEIAELHWVSMSLFGAALMFVVITILQLAIRGNVATNPSIDAYVPFGQENPTTSDDVWNYKFMDMSEGKHFIDSITVIFTALNFQVNLFPIHSNQVDKSVKGSVKTIGTSMVLVPAVYVVVAFCSIMRYGNQLDDSVLNNIGLIYPYNSWIWTKEDSGFKFEYTQAPLGKQYWESYIMQILFLIILSCHIPYLYFSGKEALLIMVDEIMRRSISLVLSKKALQEDINEDEVNAAPEFEAEGDATTGNSREGSQLKQRLQSGAPRDGSGTQQLLHGKGGQTRGSEIMNDERFSQTRQSLQANLSKIDRKTLAAVEKDLPDNLQEISGQEATALGYKSMNPTIYNLCTVILYAVEVALGLAPVGLGPLFGFIGTFSGVGISYFLPSLFLIRGYSLFCTDKYRQENSGYVKLAYVNFALGVIFFFLFLANNVLVFISFPHVQSPTAYCNENMGAAAVLTCLNKGGKNADL